MSGLRDIREDFLQYLCAPLGRHGLMPASIVRPEQLEGGGQRRTADPFGVFGQADLVHKRQEMLAIRNQPLEQGFVDGEVLRSRVAHEHPLILAFAEGFDLLEPNCCVAKQTQLRVVAEDQVLRSAPLCFQSPQNQKDTGT